MNQEQWFGHICRRSDFTSRITHLTRRTDEKSAFQILCKILDEKRILGSGLEGYIRQNKKAVCFQDVPLYSLAENVKYEEEYASQNKLGINKVKFRYEAFGLRFNKGNMFQRGARPVIYGLKNELDNLPANEQWRCVQLDLNDSNNIIDWTHEREWRIEGDLTFEYNEIEIILGCKEYYKRFIDYYSDKELLKEINGVIVLDSLFK